MKAVFFWLLAATLAFAQVTGPSGQIGTGINYVAPSGGAVGGAANLTTVTCIPFASSTPSILNCDANLTYTAAVGVSSPLFSSTTNCASSAGTCAAAPAGSVSIAAAATTVTVATTAVKSASVILVVFDSSLGTKLSVTCNTTVPTAYGVSARTNATSFVITATAPTTNPACFNYFIIN